MTEAYELALTKSAREVLTERLRQVQEEGWTARHDDRHYMGEIAQAAATYALHSTGKYGTRALTWPWSSEWWKPTNPRRDLVKAGALILAELERLDRLEDYKAALAQLALQQINNGEK